MYPPATGYIVYSSLFDYSVNLTTNNFHYRTDRVCSKTTVVDGVTIPQGAVVVVPILMLHHDPQYWKDPEKFDPDRYADI